MTTLHAPLTRAATDWLLCCAQAGPVSNRPSYPLPINEIDAILDAAELHGVGPACLRLLHTVVAAPSINAAQNRHGYQAAQELLLCHHGEGIVRALRAAAVDAMIIKGPVFARRLYHHNVSRTFTDIDILIRVGDRDVASKIMRERGFTLQELAYRAEKAYCEDQWSRSEPAHIPIEIHGNLVHNPQLRASMSVTYTDVLAAGNGDAEDPTALLFVAAAHGAISHQFDRLQHLVDVALAASGVAGSIDSDRLAAIAAQTGTKAAVHAALVVAGNLLAVPACYEIASQLRPTRYDRFAARLITRATVLQARSSARSASSWRRKAFRQALRF